MYTICYPVPIEQIARSFLVGWIMLHRLPLSVMFDSTRRGLRRRRNGTSDNRDLTGKAAQWTAAMSSFCNWPNGFTAAQRS
jgi:hypothetical protein